MEPNMFDGLGKLPGCAAVLLVIVGIVIGLLLRGCL